MKIFKTIGSFRTQLNVWRKNSLTIGFVPTMGYLHKGHTSLVEKSKVKCDITIVSIFVNPTQFGPNEDFNKYPRNLEADLDLLSKLNIDAVLIPGEMEMYPSGIYSLTEEDRKGAYIDILPRSSRLEGKKRPLYFSGVATIIVKLLNIVNPSYIFFGQKDIEQYFKVRTLVRDLLYPVEVFVGPTIRESDGLAYSSRNKYLSSELRSEAILLYKTLIHTTILIRKIKSPSRSAADIIKEATSNFYNVRLNKSSELEYLSISNIENLSELHQINNGSRAIILGAAKIGDVRLIDNVLFNCTLEDIMNLDV